MRIAVITIIDAPNFGTVLQAYAFCRVLSKSGASVELIRYERKVSEILYLFKKRIKTAPSLLKKVWAIPAYLILLPFAIIKYNNFLKKNTNLSRRYKSIAELKKNPPEADVYFTGSDQVWNSCYNNGIDKAFFLDFVPPHKRCYAYAASLGISDFDTVDKSVVKNLLKKYQKITVREECSVQILKNLDIANVDFVLDPVFLLSREEWILFSKQRLFKKKERYVLVYCVGDKLDYVMELASYIAREKGLKLYFVEATFNINSLKYKVDKRFNNASIHDFLNCFFNADFAVVSSFHGTAFSLVSGINFFSVLPNMFNNRQLNLLKYAGLEHLSISEGTVLDNLKIPEIDYTAVYSKINALREKSLNILHNMK